MRKKLGLLGLIFAFSFLSFSPGLQAASKSLSLDIKGMSCGICAAKVENSIKKLEGISKCMVDHKTGKGSVEFDDSKVNTDKILEACNKTGFKCQAGN